MIQAVHMEIISITMAWIYKIKLGLIVPSKKGETQRQLSQIIRALHAQHKWTNK